VQGLERVCRQLKETIEDSKHDSMERSIMGEVSSEALRMLHRQISSLEREKNAWSKRQQGLRQEIEKLQQQSADKESQDCPDDETTFSWQGRPPRSQHRVKFEPTGAWARFFFLFLYLHAVSYLCVPCSLRGKKVLKALLAVVLPSHPRCLVVAILRFSLLRLYSLDLRL